MADVYTPNKTVTSGRQIDYIVLHDMEAPEGPATAENVAAYFGNASVQASAHWCHDQDSSVQVVDDKDVAWHAPGVNHNSIGHEQAGYARQSVDEWMADEAMLSRVAAKVAEECIAYSIPIQYVDADGIRAGVRGITSHLQVTAAYPVVNGQRMSHWDPGYEYPIEHFLDLVRLYAGGQAPPPDAGGPIPVTPSNVLQNGSEGPEVASWQAILIGAGLPVGSDDGQPDGNFGPTTEESTKEFQRQLGISDDGVVGDETRNATARFIAWLAALGQPAPPAQPAGGLREDGILGPATISALQAKVGATVDGGMGPDTISHLQQYLGTPVDGVISKPSMMVTALQYRIGAQTDGIWGGDTTLHLQQALNGGTF